MSAFSAIRKIAAAWLELQQFLAAIDTFYGASKFKRLMTIAPLT